MLQRSNHRLHARHRTHSKHADGDADVAEKCIPCDVQNGLATVPGNVWSFYVSRPNGVRMLVFEGRPGTRIRFNGTIEVSILEISSNEITLVVEDQS